MIKTDNWIETFPGGKLVRNGLADLNSGRRTVPACLVSMGRIRLSRAGLLPRQLLNRLPEPELQLYRLLREEGGDAYSRYNSLVRELASFMSALDRVRPPTSAA